MHCEQALRRLSEYLDEELDAVSSSELARHLAECRECFSLAEFERRLRTLIRRSCECERIPPALQQRLSRLLQSF
jgi:mycothiol system anti-sigma-R factor